MDVREIEVRLIRPGDVIVLTGVRYHVRKVEPEPGFPDYVYLHFVGDDVFHKRLDDTMPVAYL